MSDGVDGKKLIEHVRAGKAERAERIDRMMDELKTDSVLTPLWTEPLCFLPDEPWSSKQNRDQAIISIRAAIAYADRAGMDQTVKKLGDVLSELTS